MIFQRWYQNSKWPPEVSFKKFCGRKNFTSEIIQILKSHSPQYGDVQVIFLRFLLKLKMAAMDEFF